jgi:hypothetical protein
LPKSFNALPSAVLLCGFAHEETVELAADDRDRDDDRVGPHGQAADSLRFPAVLPNFVREHLPGELRSARIECSCAAVNVVVADCARRQLELAQFERLVGKQAQQFLACG